MQLANIQWSSVEEEIARTVFERAYQREITALMQQVRERANAIASLEELWMLHDFLSVRRHEIDGKYEFDQASLIFVFAELLKEGWLQFDELAGLAPEKQTKIAALTRM
ncbi:MAG: hypothetical protein NW220_12445 [Leptolyngbyaceae cyanobacterium bins.349]|nr:hypothetical protein [Leptolyngbyaceae cyanobacterium bins.349]